MKTFLYNLASDKYKGFFAGIIKFFLLLLSFLYCLIVGLLILHAQLFRKGINCKVISVGNITLGGTGKTTLVEFIAGYLKRRNHKVAILSRGYKRNRGTMGDEPYMLLKHLKDIPVIVDSNRVRAANIAIRDYGVDTVILDDAFQQWRLIKDLEIVTIDSANPFGNHHLIPRGILREKPHSLKRADIFCITKTKASQNKEELKAILSKINPQASVFTLEHEPIAFYALDKSDEPLALEQLKNKEVILFCGIGDPDSFEDSVSLLGIKIILHLKFPDHHNYTDEDYEEIISASKNKGTNVIITTEKDAARIEGLPQKLADNIKIYTLRIEAKFWEDEEKFLDRLDRLYSV